MSTSASNSQTYQLNAYPSSSSASNTSSSSATSGGSSHTANTSTSSSSANCTSPTLVQGPGPGPGPSSSGSSPIVTPPHSPSLVANSPPASPVVPQSPKGKWKKYRKSCCSLNRYTAIAALIIAALVAYPSFKSWEISKWTARKDFFLYCRENISNLRDVDIQPCQAAIDAGLPAPPKLLVRHVGVVGIIISVPSMALALFSVWRERVRSRQSGYKEVRSWETDLENSEAVSLVPLHIHADRELGRSYPNNFIR